MFKEGCTQLVSLVSVWPGRTKTSWPGPLSPASPGPASLGGSWPGSANIYQCRHVVQSFSSTCRNHGFKRRDPFYVKYIFCMLLKVTVLVRMVTAFLQKVTVMQHKISMILKMVTVML